MLAVWVNDVFMILPPTVVLASNGYRLARPYFSAPLAPLSPPRPAGPWGAAVEDPESLAAFFWPASDIEFGRMHLGWLWQGEHHSYQAGMNDQGLAYSSTAVPHVVMNPHPERPLSWNRDHIWDSMLKGAATVADAVAIAESFDYTEGLWGQTMVTDPSGEVAVIGPGNDGELAIT